MRFKTSSIDDGGSSDSGFLEGSLMTDEFCSALGRFVLEFARSEVMLKDVFTDFAQIPAPTARAVFDGMRVDVLLGKIRRVHQATGRDLHPALLDAFSQLKAIGTMRNTLIHQGVEQDAGGQLITTNWDSAHTDDGIATVPVSVAFVENMTTDLQTIQRAMIVLTQPEDAGPLHELGLAPPIPWLYKPPQPSCKPARSSDSLRRTSPQRKPSPE